MRRSLAWRLAALLVLALSSVARADEAGDGELSEPSEAREPVEVEMPELPALDRASVEAELEKALQDDAHPFCRRAGYRLRRRELHLCEIAPASRERCPGFTEACERALDENLYPFGRRMNGATPPPDPEPETDLSNSAALAVLKAVMQALGYVVLAVILAGALALMAVLLLKLFRSRNKISPSDAPPASVPEAEEKVAELGFERDAELHLHRARRLAANGDYATALFELHLGVILSLDARGLINARRGRSNGDYARDLAGQPELRAAFREVARSTEAVQFGGRQATRDAFENVLRRAGSLIGSVILCLAALSMVGCDEGEGAGEPERAAPQTGERCGTRADGYSLFCQMLETQWRAGPVTVRYRALKAIDEDVATIVLLSGELNAAQVQTLDQWVSGGGVLVLAAPLAYFENVLEVRRAGPFCDKALSEGRSLTVASVAFADSQLTPRVTCSSGETLIGQAAWGDGQLLFLAGPELLQNASLVAGQNAWALTPVFLPLSGPVEIVGSWTGIAADGPVTALANARLLPWLFQLLLLGLAHALWRGAPFGRRIAPAPNLRRRFSEHVTALGERWAEVRASRTALGAYASYALEVLRERVPGTPNRGIAELSTALSKRTGRPEGEVARTLAQARLIREGSELESNEPEHLDTLKKLGRLLEETGGSR